MSLAGIPFGAGSLYSVAMTLRRPTILLAAGAALASGACVSAAPPADGVFRARVTVDHATFGACAARALAAKYLGEVTTSGPPGADVVRIVRTAPFAGLAMDVRRAGRESEVEVRPASASGALWKDLSLCLPPI